MRRARTDPGPVAVFRVDPVRILQSSQPDLMTLAKYIESI